MSEFKDSFEMGERIRFADGNATVKPGGGVVVASGVVNGEVLVTDGNETYVPVFASREGREPTTIWVAASNIISVDDEEEEKAP